MIKGSGEIGLNDYFIYISLLDMQAFVPMLFGGFRSLRLLDPNWLYVPSKATEPVIIFVAIA